MTPSVTTNPVALCRAFQQAQIDQGVTEDSRSAGTCIQVVRELTVILGVIREGGEESQAIRGQEYLAGLIAGGGVVDQVSRGLGHELFLSVSIIPI